MEKKLRIGDEYFKECIVPFAPLLDMLSQPIDQPNITAKNHYILLPDGEKYIKTIITKFYISNRLETEEIYDRNMFKEYED